MKYKDVRQIYKKKKDSYVILFYNSLLIVVSIKTDSRISAAETKEEIVRIKYNSSKKNDNIFHIINQTKV